MGTAITAYFQDLGRELAAAWNRFWFTPRDPYWLGVIRCLTGVLALYWYLSYALNLREWFGPNGLVTPKLLSDWHGERWYFSVFNLVDDGAGLWVVYGIGAICIVAMGVGFYSRLSTPLAVLFVISLLQRGPLFARPGDDVLAMLLVYLSLGPTGKSWSVDAWISRSRGEAEADYASPSIMANLTARLIQVHLAALYFAMAIAQLSHDNSWWAGTALWGLVARVDSRWVDATWLQSLPVLLSAWTLLFLVFELSMALIWWPPLRPLLIGLGMLLWGSLAIVGGMVTLPCAMVIAGLAFLVTDLRTVN